MTAEPFTLSSELPPAWIASGSFSSRFELLIG